MKSTIAFHLEGMHQEGLAAPQPHSFSTYLEVPAKYFTIKAINNRFTFGL